MKRNALIMENLVAQAKGNGIVTVKVPQRYRWTAYEARKVYVDPIVQRLANMKKYIEFGQGLLGTSDSDYALLVSENFKYQLAETLSIQGSDKAFDVVITGALSKIFGLPVLSVPYLDNKYSVSETRIDKDGKTVFIPKEIDTTGIDAILFHKNAFVYKFGNPIFMDDKVVGAPYRIYTHIQNYPTKRLPILGKFCLAFKFEEVTDEGDLITFDNPFLPSTNQLLSK